MDELLKQKVISIFEIFTWFLIVDWDIEENEFDNMLLELSDYLDKYLEWMKPEMNFDETIKKIAEDPENFSKNANYMKMMSTKQEKLDILFAISKIIFSDNDFSGKEYELFEKLRNFWEITKEDLIKWE